MTSLLEPADAGPLDFDLPPDLEAHDPPEGRGLARDQIRLQVASGLGHIANARFLDLAAFLQPGDLVVVNTSATLPAALPNQAPDGSPLLLHLSTSLPDGMWLTELRRPRGHASVPLTGDARDHGRLALPGGAAARLLRADRHGRLRRTVLHLPGDVRSYLAAHGRPIRYGFPSQPWPLRDYQTVYARESGSAEMPSAGRGFSRRVLSDLHARGVGVAPLVLHTGVSSLEQGELPYAERFAVPTATAEKVNATHAAGGRVIAVGTTVVRALETVTDDAGTTHPGTGWTDLIVGPWRRVRAVDGLVTGWHEPQASHLLLLEAVAGRDLLERSYVQALHERYRWHQFGDACLLLP